jgi:hypothetical protein
MMNDNPERTSVKMNSMMILCGTGADPGRIESEMPDHFLGRMSSEIF